MIINFRLLLTCRYPTHLDFETERLSLAAEPIAELVPDEEVDAGSTHPAIENQVTPVAGLTEPD